MQFKQSSHLENLLSRCVTDGPISTQQNSFNAVYLRVTISVISRYTRSPDMPQKLQPAKRTDEGLKVVAKLQKDILCLEVNSAEVPISHEFRTSLVSSLYSGEFTCGIVCCLYDTSRLAPVVREADFCLR